jgi:hypothetical protein
VSEQVIDGYCNVEQPGREIKSGPHLAAGRLLQAASDIAHLPAMVHAVKVTDGILRDGTDQGLSLRLADVRCLGEQ